MVLIVPIPVLYRVGVLAKFESMNFNVVTVCVVMAVMILFSIIINHSTFEGVFYTFMDKTRLQFYSPTVYKTGALITYFIYPICIAFIVSLLIRSSLCNWYYIGVLLLN